MNDFDKISLIWCEYPTVTYCGILFFNHTDSTLLNSYTLTYGVSNDYVNDYQMWLKYSSRVLYAMTYHPMSNT